MSRLGTQIADIPNRLRARAAENMKDAATVLKEGFDQTLGTPGTADHPSAPGEPPHMVTGRTRASIRIEVDEQALTLTVIATGIRARVAAYLNEGTERMAARPFVRPTIERCRAAVRKALMRFHWFK